MADSATITSPFIYLDNAATSWPKPDTVPQAISRYYREFGVAASRGGSGRALAVDRMVQRCRSRLASLLNANQDDQIVFGFNGTDVLNMAIHGLVRAGDRVVASVAEHNSVLRPLEFLKEQSAIDVQYARCNEDGLIDVDHLATLMLESVRLVCISHVSNVTGLVQPISDIAKICRRNNTILLVDAAQSVGHMPVNVRELDCDLLAAAGHKGLLGPFGTAFLYLSSAISDQVQPYRQGGTGTQSEKPSQPSQLPERLESGNLNVGGLSGLLGGIEYVLERGIDEIHAHEHDLRTRIVDRLKSIDGISIHGNGEDRTAIVSINIEGFDCQTVASMLDSSFGIQVRAGFQCAPKMHQSLGTASSGGTVRISPGVFNTHEEIDRLVEAVEQISTSLV